MIERIISQKTLRLINDDITTRNVDVIVNPANSLLKHGGGVAKAIVAKGGKIIQEESNKIGFVPVGTSAITTSGDLPCYAVIHTVGPKMGEGDEDSKLRMAVHSALKLASEKNFSSISIPAISSGIFGFPKDRCAYIIVEAIKNFIKGNNDSPLNLFEMCVFDDETFVYFQKEISKP
ncbi:macrodomain protein [Nitrosopumilus sp. b1]|uniref:macro domain-containing protein n=1 Tax=Nitrosopumilus sp. b1 TaxID=2109907 RepID=UPI001C716D96|nr:macro domain-containing protein [Nitrosopumilus sp. b1]KAF6242099.1 macrodomain protein [Nitrosopumilus sp. b1]